jgi:hypothetical protein
MIKIINRIIHSIWDLDLGEDVSECSKPSFIQQDETCGIPLGGTMNDM